MSGISNALEELLLGYTLCGSGFTPATTLYICLATSITSDGGSVTEVTTNVGYARQPVTFQAPSNPAGTCVSSIDAAFGPATANWGSVTYLTLVNSNVIGSGIHYFWGLLDVARNVQTGDSLTIAASALAVSLA